MALLVKEKQSDKFQKEITIDDIIQRADKNIRLTHSNANDAIMTNVKNLTNSLIELSERVLKSEKLNKKLSTTIQSLEAQLTKQKKLKSKK